MDISTTDYKRCSLIKASGRVDSNTFPQFENTIRAAADDKNNIVLDTSSVEFMSSAGLRVMVSALKACSGAGGGFVLATPSERVSEVLQLAGLTSLFTIYDDVTAAVGSF